MMVPPSALAIGPGIAGTRIGMAGALNFGAVRLSTWTFFPGDTGTSTGGFAFPGKL